MAWAVLDTRLKTEVESVETEAEAREIAGLLNRWFQFSAIVSYMPERYAVAFVEADGCKEGT